MAQRIALGLDYTWRNTEGRTNRRDAEYAKGRIFTQSGDGDWANGLAFGKDMFLFVVVSRQTKSPVSATSAVNKSLSVLFRVSLRLICDFGW